MYFCLNMRMLFKKRLFEYFYWFHNSFKNFCNMYTTITIDQNIAYVVSRRNMSEYIKYFSETKTIQCILINKNIN